MFQTPKQQLISCYCYRKYLIIHHYCLSFIFNFADFMVLIFVFQHYFLALVFDIVHQCHHQIIREYSSDIISEWVPYPPLFINRQFFGTEFSFLVDAEAQFPVINTIENNWRYCTPHKIPLPPKFSVMFINFALLVMTWMSVGFQIFIELGDELGIFDAVGIDEGGGIIEIEQSLKVNKEIILILNECLDLAPRSIDQQLCY